MSDELSICPVCLENFTTSRESLNRPFILSCGHNVCESCKNILMEYDENRRKCPCCRASIHTAILNFQFINLIEDRVRQLELQAHRETPIGKLEQTKTELDKLMAKVQKNYTDIEKEIEKLPHGFNRDQQTYRADFYVNSMLTSVRTNRHELEGLANELRNYKP